MSSQSLKPGWKMFMFGDFVQNVSVRVDPAEAKTDVYVGLEHLDPSTLHLRKWGHPSDVTGQKLAFKKGDVIFGRRRAYQRKLAVAEFDGICSAHAMVVRAKPEMILPEFLPFFLQSDMFMDRAIAISVGSLSPTINWTALKVLEFSLPPLDEQKRIAEILWAADETTERYADSALRIVDIADATLSKSFEKHKEVLSWTPAIDVCEKISVGIVIKPASYYVAKGGHAALRSLNVMPGRFVLDELVYISEEGQKKNNKSILKEGDVVVVRTGRPGDACVVGTEQAGFNAIDLIIARPSKGLLPEYLSSFVNSGLAKQQMRRGIAGTAQSHFNIGEFKKLLIPMMPLEDQQEALSLLEQVRAKQAVLTDHLVTAAEVRKALLNKSTTVAAHV
jgi:type I restriction enzyme, S subunit